MRFDSSYAELLHHVSELLIWSGGFINISEIEDLDLYEFEVYREIFKNKFETEQATAAAKESVFVSGKTSTATESGATYEMSKSAPYRRPYRQ